MSTVTQRLGRRIRQLRQVQELTQEQLAEAAELSVSFLGGIERGIKSPTIETLQKLANALGITLSELMSFDAGVTVIDENKSQQLRHLLSEYAEKIEQLYHE